MSKEATELPAGVRSTDILTVTQFAHVFPMDAVTRTLDSFGCGTIRVRATTSERLVYFQMMLSLFRECSQRAVYRTVAAALDKLEGKPSVNSDVPTASALTQGLDRLNPQVFERLFHDFAAPAGKKGEKGIWFRDWRKISIDGFTLNTEGTKENREFFEGPSNQHGIAPLPQVRCVCFVETGSHLILKAANGNYHTGEITLAHELVPFIERDWLLIADRNFYSFDFFKQVSERGAAILVRLQKGLSLQSEKLLLDGSHIVTIYSNDDRKRQNGIQARLIQYAVTGTKKRKKETIYLLTNLLDPDQGIAEELGWLYRERWEHENTLDELKTHLNLSAITLRSKSPERVLQELWGMYMAHYAIRLLMYKAAVRGKIDPDRLSFTHTINVVKDEVTRERSSTCDTCGSHDSVPEAYVIQKVLEERLPPRRARTGERSVRKREKYAVTKSGQRTFKETNHQVKVRKQWSYRVPS